MVCGVRPTGITMQTIRSPRKAIPTQPRADEMRPSLVFSLRLVAPALLVMLFGCGGGSSSTAVNPPPGGPPALGLSAFVSGVASPVGMEVPNDDSGRLFVLEQGGRIRIIQNGVLVATPFLDITSKIESGGEKGLLGLAFHPSFSSNRRFFVYYTRRLSLQLQSVFSEYAASSSNPNQADASSERILLVVNQPFDNHNGGQLAFGPDGFLYIGLGDGGSGCDPQGNGQNLQTLLGKILRIGLAGAYAFRDLFSGHSGAGVQDSSGDWRQTLVLNHNLTVSSFGQDSAGELYLLDYGDGAVLRLRAAP